MRYQMQFCDHAGHVFATESLAAVGDEQAITTARQRYNACIDLCYQVQRGDRLIHTEWYVPRLRPRSELIAPTCR